MAPKTNCNAVKLASVITYLQNSRSCHTIKDLEKQLPSAASISSMQVKDYLQALQDDNKIKVEKIGSGNWYWSFTSDDKIKCDEELKKAQSTHDKAEASVSELRARLTEIAAQHKDEEDMLSDGLDTREELMAKRAVVEADVKSLQVELGMFSDNDPTELERKKREIDALKEEVERYTDDIYSMEGYIKKLAPEAINLIRMDYGDEWDEEEEDFKVVE